MPVNMVHTFLMASSLLLTGQWATDPMEHRFRSVVSHDGGDVAFGDGFRTGVDHFGVLSTCGAGQEKGGGEGKECGGEDAFHVLVVFSFQLPGPNPPSSDGQL